MWKWLVAVPILLVLPFVAMAVLGSFLPKEHKASVRVALPVPVEQAWPVVADIEAWPTWNPDVKITKISDKLYAWEHKGDTIPSEVIESANGRFVTRIADEKLPFGGTWTWEVAATAQGSTVTITEDGVVKNTIFRFLAHHVFGYTGSMEQMLGALSKKFGGSPPEVTARGK